MESIQWMLFFAIQTAFKQLNSRFASKCSNFQNSETWKFKLRILGSLKFRRHRASSAPYSPVVGSKLFILFTDSLHFSSAHALIALNSGVSRFAFMCSSGSLQLFVLKHCISFKRSSSSTKNFLSVALHSFRHRSSSSLNSPFRALFSFSQFVWLHLIISRIVSILEKNEGISDFKWKWMATITTFRGEPCGLIWKSNTESKKYSNVENKAYQWQLIGDGWTSIAKQWRTQFLESPAAHQRLTDRIRLSRTRSVRVRRVHEL